MELQCSICNYKIIHQEIQPHIIACGLRGQGYKPQVSVYRPKWIWLVDVFSLEAFLLSIRKEGEFLYTVDYTPEKPPKQFNDLDEALTDMWWRLNEYERNL